MTIFNMQHGSVFAIAAIAAVVERAGVHDDDDDERGEEAGDASW